MKRIAMIAALFVILSPCLLAQKEAPPPKADSTFGRTQLFQIIILTGTTDGPDELKDLPKNAEKAIHDIRNFLPYKRYVLVDVALLRMGSHAGVGQTELQGKVESATIEFVARMSYREQDGKLAVDHFALARMDQQRRTVLETSFGLVRGETVVVGTSKLNGEGKALIVLVTAVPTS